MEQSQILRHAADTLDALAVPYIVVGSCASIAYLEIWKAVVETVDAPDRPPGPGVP
jgi:hypothetical protein